jgi:Restriction endonuclease fold toxin 5
VVVGGVAKGVRDGLDDVWRYFRRRPDIDDPPVDIPPLVRPVPRVDPPPPAPAPRPPPVPRRPPFHDPETGTANPEPAPEAQPEQQTERETSTTTDEMQECETCPDSEPRKQGHAAFRTLTGTEASKLSGAQYQNWVIPWFRWAGNQIEEWEFQAVKFDGIDPAICQLIEAKGKYGLFFRNPESLDVVPYEWAKTGPLKDNQLEFLRQYGKIVIYQPQATLHWVMHTWAYYIYMSPIIQGQGYIATSEHRPFPGWSVDEEY